MGNLNPFRYRGYYQDTETGFYYLMSRYYDTVTHRFVNADGYFTTGLNPLAANMNIYCGNNPVMYTDPNGEFFGIVLIAVIVLAVAVPKLIQQTANAVIDNSGANDAEKKLAKNDYFAAYQVNQSKNIAVDYLNRTYGAENDKDGTQVNAYRHAMWNAIMTDKIGVVKAKEFADAHEDIPNNPIAHKEMDLHNNALGRKIALDYAGQGYDVFSDKIQEAINNGEAKVLKWDSNVK